MQPMADAIADQISKLEAARQLVLADASHYSVIIPGILPIIGAHAQIDIRRWGADFLAEAFANPLLPLRSKENLGIQVLSTLKELMETPGEDDTTIKSTIQTAASIYGLIFRHITNNPQETTIWDNMAAIKSNILSRWDTASTGIRICCIKFVQRVVQVQTPGIIADPRRPEQNEISLALVPRDHPLIPPINLEAEASGLLDRLLNVFYENPSNAVLVNATLNCLVILVRTRQTIANKIVSTVLNFNPFKQAVVPMSPKAKVQIRSMERTTRAFLMNTYRRNENGTFAARIKQHVERLNQSRLEIFDDSSRKSGAPAEPGHGMGNAKRALLGAQMNGQFEPPLPPGPISFAQLYTLTSEEALKSFDVAQLPLDLIVKITIPLLQLVDKYLLDEAITAIRGRVLSLSRVQSVQNQSYVSTTTNLDDEESDYEPTFEPMEDSEQIINKMDTNDGLATDLALGPFRLPQPPALTQEEAEQLGKGTISRVFSMMGVLDEPGKAPKPGLNRLAGSNYDKEAWITVISRLATRSTVDWEGDEEEEVESQAVAKLSGNSLADGIRETLWKYVIEDFRTRIPIAIAWLNEEWYNDRIIQQQAESQGLGSYMQNYEKWVLRVLDGIIPYLDAKDKVLIRFLSEIPSISEAVLERVKSMVRDPDRVSLAVNAIHYLVLLRPPVRESAIDALVDLWRNYGDAKKPTAKLLAKWRPDVLESGVQQA